MKRKNSRLMRTDASFYEMIREISKEFDMPSTKVTKKIAENRNNIKYDLMRFKK